MSQNGFGPPIRRTTVESQRLISDDPMGRTQDHVNENSVSSCGRIRVRVIGCSTILVSLICGSTFAEQLEQPEVRLFDGIGTHSRTIVTNNPKTQQYFDQGLMFLFAYNHDEAIRAFRQASRFDPDCAMAYWGISLASGMNYNDPNVTPERAKVASEALASAREKAIRETSANRALILALVARYPDPAPQDPAEAETAYTLAMKTVWETFATDADAGALYAESRMNLRPWDLWKDDGTPQPGTLEVLSTLDAVLKLDSSHALANHLHIHAVEASPNPGRADASAEALRGRYPGLGHLLHMPSHVDIRRGRWREATEANRIAIESDDKYSKAVPEQGFYRMYIAHNYHMLTFAAMMQGEFERSLSKIRAMAAGIPKEWLAKKENAAVVDGFVAMPLEVLKRFGKWDGILNEPDYPSIFPIARAMRHHNRGVAFAAKGELNNARDAQKSFREIVKQIPEDATFVNNKAVNLLAIAELTLEGEILLREGKFKESIEALNQAVAFEDKLRYSEPPDWFVPVRHSLGAVLLRDNQAAAAEAVYREDLRRWPENGWSLYGLAKAVKAQGKTEDFRQIEERFNTVWKYADTKIFSSCLCLQD